MKCINGLIVVFIFGYGSFSKGLSLQLELSEENAYQLYEQLKVTAEADPSHKRLVKKTEKVFCSKTSYYPGDFEYSCLVNLDISEKGELH